MQSLSLPKRLGAPTFGKAANLAEKIKSIYDGRPDKVIFVKGNPESKYNDIIHAMDVARGLGLLPADATAPPPARV